MSRKGSKVDNGSERLPLIFEMIELSHSLAAEKVKGEGAQEGRDAVLLEQVEFNELTDRLGELRFQQLHPGTFGSRCLRR